MTREATPRAKEMAATLKAAALGMPQMCWIADYDDGEPAGFIIHLSDGTKFEVTIIERR